MDILTELFNEARINKLVGKPGVIEICVTNRMEKDYLFHNKYLILTHKTYDYIKSKYSYLIEDIPVYISDEKFLNYFKVDNLFESIIKKPFE
jgi:hypothetical protein